MHEHFGQPINYDSAPTGELSANDMVTQFVGMKNHYKKHLDELMKDDPDARRHYCSNDCAYIFDVEFLEAIVNTVKATGKDGCMVLFQGVRKDEEQGNAFGRPTLIATAYTWDKDDNLVHQKIPKTLLKITQPLADEDADGLEHPGDGSSPAIGLDDWRPMVLDSVTSGSGKTEFKIKTTIPRHVIVEGFLRQKKSLI